MMQTASGFVVIGAGGHARVIIEAIRASGGVVAGVVDPAPASPFILGAPVLGGDDALAGLRAQGLDTAVVALGGNALRARVAEKALAIGFSLPAVVHPSALIAPSARIGAGAVIMARAVIGTDALVQDLVIVNTGALVDHDGDLGLASHVAPGCALAGNVHVGARTLVGVGSSVRPGVTIGADALVGAGSAVICDVKDGATVGGAPARLLKVERVA